MRPPYAGVQGERSRVEDSLGSQMHCKNCEKQVKKLNYNFNAYRTNKWILGGFCRGFTEISMFSPSCSMIFQNLTLHVENAFEFLRTRCLRNSFRQQKLRRRMSWPPRRSIWKMRKRPLAGKHYETAWKLGFEILEWPTFSESLLGWARLL